MRISSKVAMDLRESVFKTMLLVSITIAVVYPGRAEEPAQVATSRSALEQAETLESVLRESLDTGPHDDWIKIPNHAMFNSAVEADYIPSVGVIVKLRVNFPISEPTLDPEVGTQPKPTDLWEKHATGRGGQVKVIQSGDEDVVIERRELRGAGVSGETFLNAAGVDPIPFEARLIEDDVKFDKERTDSLKAALVATFAKYGHRLTAVPEGGTRSGHH